MLGGQLTTEKGGREDDRLVGQEPQLREEMGLREDPESWGKTVRLTWVPDSLPYPPGCLLAFLLALGRGHAYLDLRHKTGQGPYSQPLLHTSPHSDPVPPRCHDHCDRGLGRTSPLGVPVKPLRTQLVPGGAERKRDYF